MNAASKARAAVETQIQRIEKKGIGGSLGSPALYKLQSAVEIAKRTTGTGDDIKALGAEKVWLRNYLKSHSSSSKLGLEANRLLTSIDMKMAKLVNSNANQLKALERQFLAEQKSFYSQYGSNDYRDTSSGSAPGGSDGISIHFHDTPATKDRHRESMLAAHAVRSAFE